MTRRESLGKLIDDNLSYSENTEKLRWILDANGWTKGMDVILGATDEQIEAFYLVWGLEAYSM